MLDTFQRAIVSLFIISLFGCAEQNPPRTVDLYERETGNQTTVPAPRTPWKTTPPTRQEIKQKILAISVDAHQLANQLRQGKPQNPASIQKKANMEARLKQIDAEIIQLTLMPTIPTDKVNEYAQRVEKLEKALKQLAQMVDTF